MVSVDVKYCLLSVSGLVPFSVLTGEQRRNWKTMWDQKASDLLMQQQNVLLETSYYTTYQTGNQLLKTLPIWLRVS